MDIEEKTFTNIAGNDSFKAVDNEIKREKKSEKIRRIVSSSITFTIFFLILLYFLIPSCHLKGSSFNGLTNLSKDDYFSFSVYNKNSSLFFFKNNEENNKKTISNSNGLLLENKINNNSFSSTITIVENYPVSKYKNSVYMADGEQANKFIENYSTSYLTESRINALKDQLEKECSYSLPVLHLPQQVLNEEDYLVSANFYLRGLNYNALKVIKGIDYPNSSNDSNWNNVMQIVAYDEKNNCNYLFTNILSEHLDEFLNEDFFPDKIMNECSKKIKENNLQTKNDFKYVDGEETISVYPFKVSYNSETKLVSISL